MFTGGLGGAGTTPNPVSAALAASRVQSARGGRMPDDVIAAAREARSLHRLQRRIRRWTRLGIVK